MKRINYTELVKSYIQNKTDLQIHKEKGNWLKIEGLDIRIYVNASKLYPDNSGWYDLSENTYDNILTERSKKFFNFPTKYFPIWTNWTTYTI